jgi:hypothetical protein
VFRILADVNVPEEYVSALRGDGHDVTYTREIPELGPEATDGAIAAYATSEGSAILSTDVKDFAELIGWYVTEGSLAEKPIPPDSMSYAIFISQHPGENYDSIKGMFDRMGLDPSCQENTFQLTSHILHDLFERWIGRWPPATRRVDAVTS